MKKLTSKDILYTALITKLLKENLKEHDKEIEELEKEEKENRDNLLTDISKILLSYKIVDSVLDLSSTEKVVLNTKFSKKIDGYFSKEAKNEYKLALKILVQSGKDRHNINNYIESLGNKEFKDKLLSEKAIKDIINSKVDKKLWSDRLWDNKEQIAKIIKNDIKDFLDGKISVNDIEKHIKNRYDTNAFNTRRLVQDNIARVQEGINNKWQEENNINYVMYSATLEKSTCDKCKEHDGKVYEISKKPVKLPQHPFCKCSYLNLSSKDWKPKTRLDNETKEVISYKTYKEWLKDKKS